MFITAPLQQITLSIHDRIRPYAPLIVPLVIAAIFASIVDGLYLRADSASILDIICR